MLMILIPGLILVGLMIWASTRIKRSAAMAFEREDIETPEFTLVKPEGFLAPVDPAEGTVFSAYSKDFGKDGNDRHRQAALEIRRFAGTGIDELLETIRSEADEVSEEQTGIIDGQRCATIIVERADDDARLETHYRLISSPNAVYQLSVNVLPENKDEFQPRIDSFLNSFSLS